MKAETDSGNIKRVVFMTELLPKIINKRPEACDKDVPIEQLLDSMSIDDYDALVSGVDSLMDKELDTEKKK
jgi:hypothetical protein